eukprot:Clim_evm112s128 gene=Clim_evmTU112s128
MTEPSYGMSEGQNGNLDAALEQTLEKFWKDVNNSMRKLGPSDFREFELPLARIKKIMKTDDEVKMISSEAPVVFSKACEIFIEELTIRAWLHTEENKRRTLQRTDVSAAINKCDMYDFLIDIVPREETAKPSTKNDASLRAPAHMTPEMAAAYYYPMMHPEFLRQIPMEQMMMYQQQWQQMQQFYMQQGGMPGMPGMPGMEGMMPPGFPGAPGAEAAGEGAAAESSEVAEPSQAVRKGTGGAAPGGKQGKGKGSRK